MDEKVDYLVVQHLEPDHSGSILKVLELFPDVKTLVVKEGDTLSLGAHTLSFVMAPMVHWPEVMVTYEASEKILFQYSRKIWSTCAGLT